MLQAMLPISFLNILLGFIIYQVLVVKDYLKQLNAYDIIDFAKTPTCST